MWSGPGRARIKALRLLYHSTLGSRVIKKRKKKDLKSLSEEDIESNDSDDPPENT